MKHINKSLKIALSVGGTIIGAGFATGKELMVFFNGNSILYIILLICSVALMGITSITYFYLRKKIPESKIFKIIFLTFSGGCYTIMLACGGQTLYDSVNIDYKLGIVITYIISILVIKFGIEGVYKFNGFIIPFIVVFIIIISFMGASSPVFLNNVKPFSNSLLYAGYNILAVLPFISAISDNIDEKEGFYGIGLGFLIVLALSVILKILLNNYYNIISAESIPILKIVSLLNPYLTYIYSVALYCAILTTAVSTLYVLTKNRNIILTSIPFVLISFLGFTTLLEKTYTYFGYVGILVILLIYSIKYLKNT